MDSLEFRILSPSAKERIAKARIALADAGDVRGAASAFSACPWLLDSDSLEKERGQPHPGLASALCNSAGAEECQLFGELIAPTLASAPDFPGLVERYFEHARSMFDFANEKMAGTRFAAMHRGLDANPHLPAGFGTKAYRQTLRSGLRHPQNLFDGMLSPDMALWWADAVEGAGFSPKRSTEILAMQISNTLNLIIHGARAISDRSSASPPACSSLGAQAGRALAIVSRNWKPAASVDERTLRSSLLAPNLFGPQGPGLASIVFTPKEPGTQAALAATIAELPEALLADLAPCSQGAFAQAIEQRRIDLAAAACATQGRPLRM